MNQSVFSRLPRLASLLCAAFLFLSACDTAEERAEKHYQAGLALLEEGDVERALVEFRNVFKLNGQHKEARLTYARLERDRENIPVAFGQYLLLVEQYPDNFESHFALAEMAFDLGNWDAVRRHGAIAAELEPDNIEVESINNSLAYTDSIRNGDVARTDSIIRTAREMIDEKPDLMSARKIVIDWLVRNELWDDAVNEIDAALAVVPKQDNLYAIRLRALQAQNKHEEIALQLKGMLQIYPEDEGVEAMLVQHYIDWNELDAAEEILRGKIDPQAEDHMPIQRLIAFLNDHRGPQAAINEIDAIIAQDSTNAVKLSAWRATLKFHSGDTQTALAEMRNLLADAERTAQTRENEVEFARMLFSEGKSEEARALVEKILEEDPKQVGALKFKAAWLIEDNQTGDAIILLREALSQTPRDPQLMTLMANAHERNGDRELMGEMLALAAEMSQNAGVEAARYGQYLLSKNDLEIAQSVLLDALRKSPQNPDLLSLLAQTYMRQQDWDRLETVLKSLEALTDPDGQRLSNELRAYMLASQNRSDDLMEFLNELAADPQFGLPADIAVIRLMLAQDKHEEAFARIDQKLTETPDSLPLRFVKAHALAEEGKLDKAEQIYRAIIDERPDITRAWVALHMLEAERGNIEKAQDVLAEALIALPENPDLLFVQAAFHEQAGNMEQAIAVYEKLYPLSGQSILVANNLASLLTTQRNDAESLQRAHVLAQRLRGTQEPAFQDTYGWVAYQVGNYEEAVQYLESAAQVFSGHPLVLYHLGKTYAALDRNEEALRSFRAAEATGAASAEIASSIEAEIERLVAMNNAGQ
ncbi:tetratricopeptide repeat protein [Ruegeria marisrubri]|uniref:tetratricopeptide repeat protein n=1 Tax=Ruegeria marisrubri TaxID=1685379 RepID=UPI001CD71155|nr:tetratricopeptide repeat protein [Ruegeria marisrubri]MCA0908516.1 tetratricopeptide repeat protein [Ruegeria marisrubri]